MLRLLRVAAVLSGICLVVIYGVLAMSDRDKPMPIALLDVSDQTLGHTLYSYMPSDDSPILIISKLLDAKFYSVSLDGLWLYVYAAPYSEIDWPYEGLYKVRLDGKVYRPYADTYPVFNAILSPDGQWLAYSRWLSYPSRQVLVLLRLQDGMEQIISELDSAFAPGKILFSPDSTRITYSLYYEGPETGDKGRYDVFLVDMTAGEFQNLTATQSYNSQLLFWTKGDEWLIFERGDFEVYAGTEIWAMQPNGSDIRPVMPAVEDGYSRHVVGWLSDSQLLVVEHGVYQVSGLHIGQTTPVWTITGYSAITPDQRILVFQDIEDGLTLWQMPITGGTPQKIATLPPMVLGLKISPNSQLALLMAHNGSGNQLRLMRVNLQEGTIQTLFTQMESAPPDFAWSPDSQWVSVYDGNGSSRWDEVLYIMRADGSDPRRLEFSQGRPAVSWFGGEPADPMDRVLVGIGVGLMVGAVGAGSVWGYRKEGQQ